MFWHNLVLSLPARAETRVVRARDRSGCTMIHEIQRSAVQNPQLLVFLQNEYRFFVIATRSRRTVDSPSFINNEGNVSAAVYFL